MKERNEEKKTVKKGRNKNSFFDSLTYLTSLFKSKKEKVEILSLNLKLYF
jgi:hypothetical protein